ncbi:Gfo/Idh/MocA family protein [Phycisphaerales bacterium AB-hyl4]|uniref:Gfo/Idh/MocA family protein n=1 Tax=Natronomicrosphaera hydrolytica TaxID=3242702 RepID=A0ABV4U671_9BACT
MKAALIGAGTICEQHLLGLNRLHDVQPVAVCDLSPVMARDTAERFNVQHAFTNHRDMLNRTMPDVVHVLTPPASHAAIVRDAIDAGAHVIVEKPVAPTYDVFRELYDHARRHDRCLVEDHNYRFNEPVRRLVALIDEGQLGHVREVELRLTLAIRSPDHRYADRNLPHASHQLPAGILHEFLTHLCYLLVHLLRVEPDAVRFDHVKAIWSNRGRDAPFRYDDLDAIVSLGQAHGRIRFTCHTAPDAFALTVHGTQGFAEADLFNPYVRLVRPRAGGRHLSPVVNAVAGGWSLLHAGPRHLAGKVLGRWSAYEGLHRFIEQTYHALALGNAPPVTFADMDAASRLLDALLQQQPQP